MKNVILLMFVTTLIVANGGPDAGSAMAGSGAIKLIDQPDVKMVQEDLKIVPTLETISVSVRYRLKNRSKSVINTSFAFPIDFRPNSEFYSAGNLNLNHYTIRQNGKKLTAKPVDQLDEVPIIFGKVKEQIKRKWYRSNITLKPGKITTLSIKYRIRPLFESWSTNKNFFSNISDYSFRYDLSPAAHWGDGVVGKLNITIDGRHLNPLNIPFKVKLPWGMTVRNKGDHLYKFSAKKLPFKEFKSISINYKPEKYLQKIAVLNADLNQKHFKHMGDLDQARKMRKKALRTFGFTFKSTRTPDEITASSTLKGNYKVKNLLDQKLSTAWVEGKKGDGIGETITLKLNPAQKTKMVYLYNGYGKDEKRYRWNNRVKTVEITYTTKDGYSEAKTVYLPDRPYSKYNHETILTLEKAKPVKMVQIKILDIYPGTKYRDTCISEIGIK